MVVASAAEVVVAVAEVAAAAFLEALQLAVTSSEP